MLATPTRILLINANTMAEMTANIGRQARAVARSPQAVEAITPAIGPQTVECAYDSALAVPGILRAIAAHETAADAFIIGGWADPGIERARALTRKPVIGIGEASMYVCNMLAARWAVVTVLHRLNRLVSGAVTRTGFAIGASERCAGVFTTDLRVSDTEQMRAETCSALVIAGRRALAAGAEALALGCAGMAGLDQELQTALGVPVIDPVQAAILLAESVVTLRRGRVG